MSQFYHKDELLTVLLELKKDGPALKGCGICQNATELYQAHYGVIVPIEAMEELMSQWPEFSGDKRFPVPSPWGGDPGSAYLGTLDVDFWNPLHSYGAARLRLLDFIIATLQEQLK